MRPSATRLRNFLVHGEKSCTAATMSAAMKPTLCRCSAYLRARIAEADPDLHRRSLAGARENKNRPPFRDERFPEYFAAGSAYSLFSAPRRPSRSPFAFRTFLAFSELGFGGSSSRSGFFFLFGLHRRRGDDGGDGEVLVLVRRHHALGQADLRIWIESPISRPSSAMWISLGIFEASHTSSSSC